MEGMMDTKRLSTTETIWSWLKEHLNFFHIQFPMILLQYIRHCEGTEA